MPGYSIHHKDHNKDNNTIGNLEQVLISLHTSHHMDTVSKEGVRLRLIENNAHMQQLVMAAKNGTYVGKNRLRKMMKGKKQRQCAYCQKVFFLKERDREDTRYCGVNCSQRGSKLFRNPSYTPLSEELSCRNCGKSFKPKSGNQFCCSNECRKRQTALAIMTKTEFRQCGKCGESYEIHTTSKRKYCPNSCNPFTRVSQNKVDQGKKG